MLLFDFNSFYSEKYIVDLNNSYGEGYIYFNPNNKYYDKKIYISGKRILSFTLSEEMKSICFFSENNLFFYIKIKNKIL